MRVIVYNRNGVLEVCRPTSPEREKEAWDKCVKYHPDARWIDDAEITLDRHFRTAWVDDNGLRVDMMKARNIHRETLRALRAPKLTALDIEYMRADEAGNESIKSAIALKKQALRDVTDDPAIENALTPEDLKAVLPEALK